MNHAMSYYALSEVFYTLQGEGAHAGTPAQFIRFAGCNLWSGIDKDRARDAQRSGASCPSFCDTDFRTTARTDIAGLLELLEAPVEVPLIVLTGGEPLLQIDQALVDALHARFPSAIVAIETNGTRPIACTGIDWVCVSPKVEDARIVIRSGNELKIVVPSYEPDDFADLARGFDHRWVTAEAHTSSVGRSLIVGDRLRQAALWVLRNPAWRLTVQTHKVVGVR